MFIQHGKDLVEYEDSSKGVFSTPSLDSMGGAIQEVELEGYNSSGNVGPEHPGIPPNQSLGTFQSFVANSVSYSSSFICCSFVLVSNHPMPVSPDN